MLKRRRVVFFHIDADEIWERRDRAEFRRELDRFRRDIGQRAGLGEKTIDHWFIPAIPYYEFESWAFANTALLLDRLSSADDLARVEHWIDDLTRLDEIADIKDALSIRDQDSHELVRRDRGFPCARLAAAGKSYAETVDRLRRASPIHERLAAPVAGE